MYLRLVYHGLRKRGGRIKDKKMRRGWKDENKEDSRTGGREEKKRMRGELENWRFR